MTTVRSAILLAALAFAGGALAGCGSSGSGSAPATNSTNRATTVVVPGPASGGTTSTAGP